MAVNLNSFTDKLETEATQDQLIDTIGKERAGERKTGPESESQAGRRGAEGGALLSFGTNPVQAHVGPIRGTRSSLQHRRSGQNQTYLLHPSSQSLLSLQQENMGRQKVYLDKLSRFFQIRNLLLRQALAECLGTLILVMFGCGAVAQQVLSSGSHGMFLTVNFAFGFAAMLGILVCGQVSGGHLNPAVTFALCLLGRDRWRKFPMFFLFQTIGAFFGAAIIFGMYYDALWDHPGAFNVTGPNATAGIFATYPGKHLTLVNGFFDQIIGTAALIVCILAIVDPFNNPIPQGLEAFTVGFVVLVIGLSMGFNSGYAVNPARDIGPRLFTAIAGWGSDVFTVRNGWFLVPLCAPFLGTIIGTMIYQLMVGFHVEGEVRDRNDAQQENVRLTNVTSNDNSKETTKEAH